MSAPAAAEPMSLDAVRLRRAVQRELDEVLAHRAAVLSEVGPELGPVAESVARLVSGGKRLRPAFAYWGFVGAGGRDEDVGRPGAVVSVAASLELFQAAALIHDDVMDASDTRRGMPAVHRQFAALHRGQGWSGDAEHFGAAGAILAGDLCLSWSDEVLTGAGLRPDALARTKPVFDRMRTQLMGGQYLDMLAQAVPLGTGEAAHAEALARARRVICFKSAKYSIEHPLLIGAALAGADEGVAAAYSAYGLPLGEAFQLRDDVLGVFGDPEATGKPAGDDLREGKRTVLVVLALEQADAAQASALREGLGDPALDPAGVDHLRAVIRETGALDRVEGMIVEAAALSRDALADAPVTETARRALADLVEAATARAA